MNTRISRNHWKLSDVGYKPTNRLSDKFDNDFKLTYRINDKEFDRIADQATTEEIELLVNTTPTYREKRKQVQIINKYINV